MSLRPSESLVIADVPEGTSQHIRAIIEDVNRNLDRNAGYPDLQSSATSEQGVAQEVSLDGSMDDAATAAAFLLEQVLELMPR